MLVSSRLCFAIKMKKEAGMGTCLFYMVFLGILYIFKTSEKIPARKYKIKGKHLLAWRKNMRI